MPTYTYCNCDDGFKHITVLYHGTLEANIKSGSVPKHYFGAGETEATDDADAEKQASRHYDVKWGE